MHVVPVERVVESEGLAVADPAILELIQERYGQALFGFALRLSLDPEHAADAVQEALYRLWRELRDRAAIEDPVAWTFRALYRIAMDQHRLARRMRALAGRLRSSERAREPGDGDELQAVWTEVDRLPERQRHALYLRYRADLPFERIGVVLGITAGATRPRPPALLVAAFVLIAMGVAAFALVPRSSMMYPGGAVASGRAESSRTCGPGDIGATYLRTLDEGASGLDRLQYLIRLTMEGSAPCTLYGQPRVTLQDADGELRVMSRQADTVGIDRSRSWWSGPPGATTVGTVEVGNWCGEVGPAPHALVLDQDGWASAPLVVDRLPSCIDASRPTLFQDLVLGAARLVVPLPTMPIAETTACRDVGLIDATLAGDLADPRTAWLAFANGSRKELVWPTGYQAEFRGDGLRDMIIEDEGGGPVMHSGDVVDGGCVTGDVDVLWLGPMAGGTGPREHPDTRSDRDP